MTKKALALCVAVFLASMTIAAWAQIAPLDRVVSERLIGRLHLSGIPASLKISPDSKRVAYVAVSRGFFTGEKKFVIVDGTEEKQYDDIGATMLTFFSPDSKRVAYGARAGNRWLVVVDGKEGRPYEGIGAGSLSFSPDSQRVAYMAGAGNKRFVVVVDGQEHNAYDGLGGARPIFSPDSNRMAYEASVGNKRVVVVDGKEQKQYDGIDTLTFSPDSKRVAYGAKGGTRNWFVVVDGNEGKKYDSLLRGGNRVIFDSPDAFHYLAETGERIYLVEETIR
jgi:Tol biopolymer transport system component